MLLVVHAVKKEELSSDDTSLSAVKKPITNSTDGVRIVNLFSILIRDCNSE